MNEAEIRRNVVDPLLSSLGLGCQNISLEKSFTIKIGRYSHEIGWEEHTARPKYDYLIKQGDKNLFIVEAKREGHGISEDDLEQALCYAKLVDPIAPFVVLINGDEAKVHETLTRKEFTGKDVSESDYAKNNFKIDLDPEIRQLALLALFSLNLDTFSSFCKKQNSDTISRLSENIPETGSLKNYIPDIFVKRHELEGALYKFTESSSSCFMISGKSGIGKTNAMCDLVKSIQKRFLCLFYNGGQISEKLENEIANDLNWEFFTNKSAECLFKQISDICKEHNQPLIVFLDAMDEWKLESASIDISKFVNYVKNKNIKMVVSCKDSKLKEFLTISGNPSTLSQNLYAVDSKTFEKSFNSSEFLPYEKQEAVKKSFNLSEFSPYEKQEAVKKYSKYFSLSEFSYASETFSACSDPLILRIVSEIYRSKTVPPSLNSAQIYRKYLEMIYNKNPSLKLPARITLTRIAGIMINHKNDIVSENLLAITNYDSFAHLIDYGVLVDRSDDAGRHNVAFSFDGLRNYIMVYHVLQLDQLPNLQDFEDAVARHIDSKLGRELFIWFKDFANSAQKEVLQDQISLHDQKLSSQYLDQFIMKTELEFPFIKKYMYPNKKLGLLVLYRKEKNFVHQFGFREYAKSDEPVIWKNVTDAMIQDGELHALMRQYRVSRLVYTARDFTNSDLEDFVEMQIFNIIKEVLKKRHLDERNNVGISLEKFFTALRNWGYLLGLPATYDTENSLLPLNMSDLREKISHLFPNHAREICYNIDLDSDDFFVLLNSFENLSKKMGVIATTALPHMDDPDYPSVYVKPSAEYFTKEGLVAYVTEFFKKYVEEYKNIVETNFPRLKDKLPTYQKFPVYVIAQILKKDSSKKGDGVMYAICKNDRSENEFEIRDYDDAKIHIIDHNGLSANFYIRTRNGTKQVNAYTSMDIFALFHSVNSKPSDLPLTACVYNQVEDDLNAVFGSNFKGLSAFY